MSGAYDAEWSARGVAQVCPILREPRPAFGERPAGLRKERVATERLSICNFKNLYAGKPRARALTAYRSDYLSGADAQNATPVATAAHPGCERAHRGVIRYPPGLRSTGPP